MKKLILLSVFLALITSCDNPQRTRSGVYDSAVSTNNLASNNPNTWNWVDGGTSSSTSGGSTGSTTGGTSNPPGFEDCDISPKHYSSATGQVGVCQSTQDEKIVAVKAMQAPADQNNNPVKLCLIPTYRDTSGSSTYLGQPQCYFPTAGQVTQGQLVKNRNGFFGNGVAFTSLSINGIMIMREGSLSAYFNCMHAYSNFIKQPECPYGAQTSPACAAMATAFMTQVCNDFKAIHSYLDLPI